MYHHGNQDSPFGFDQAKLDWIQSRQSQLSSAPTDAQDQTPKRLLIHSPKTYQERLLDQIEAAGTFSSHSAPYIQAFHLRSPSFQSSPSFNHQPFEHLSTPLIGSSYGALAYPNNLIHPFNPPLINQDSLKSTPETQASILNRDENEYYRRISHLYKSANQLDLAHILTDQINSILSSDPFLNDIPLDFGFGHLDSLNKYNLQKSNFTYLDAISLDDLYLFEQALRQDTFLNESERLHRWKLRLDWETLPFDQKKKIQSNMPSINQRQIGIGPGGWAAYQFSLTPINFTYGYYRLLLGQSGLFTINSNAFRRGTLENHYQLSDPLINQYPIWKNGGLGLGRSLISWLDNSYLIDKPNQPKNHHQTFSPLINPSSLTHQTSIPSTFNTHLFNPRLIPSSSSSFYTPSSSSISKQNTFIIPYVINGTDWGKPPPEFGQSHSNSKNPDPSKIHHPSNLKTALNYLNQVKNQISSTFNQPNQLTNSLGPSKDIQPQSTPEISHFNHPSSKISTNEITHHLKDLKIVPNSKEKTCNHPSDLQQITRPTLDNQNSTGTNTLPKPPEIHTPQRSRREEDHN
ncbi:hypothetical protein O181_099005 [Austropuccinia psidii MF-1]|uniref:Uncharacterized protein n=1 Tax=Austropuccinia psidii MF-1 TaxID=1389203 RepID=A0A9Q3JAA2_9BASI|nr:hypothetical protein [Austropuccinia psidii MF-1]